MGWDWHERQQRSVDPAGALDRRTNHVKEMYSAVDLDRVKELLDLYRVSYIVVGELERSYYPPPGISKFEQLAAEGYLQLAYSEGTVLIYEVVERAQRLPANR